MDRAIIGASKEAERPIRPAEATGLALVRHVRGDTSERREARYAARLRASPVTVKSVLRQHIDQFGPKAAVCVVSSREKLEEANRRLGDVSIAAADEDDATLREDRGVGRGLAHIHRDW